MFLAGVRQPGNLMFNGPKASVKTVRLKPTLFSNNMLRVGEGWAGLRPILIGRYPPTRFPEVEDSSSEVSFSRPTPNMWSMVRSPSGADWSCNDSRDSLQGAPARIPNDSLLSPQKQLRSLAGFAGRFTGDEDPRDPKRDLRAGGR